MIEKYINTHKERFIKELFELLKFPTISAQKKYKKEIDKAAEYIANLLLKAGADRTEIIKTSGNPLVYAEKFIDKDYKTLLIYGHYDVQPIDPIEEWDNDPFAPIIKDGKIYARGSADDKGQVIMQIKALEVLTATESLKYNLKFILEGEEEMGSSGISEFLDTPKNIEMLTSNGLVVSDTEIIDSETPSIPVGLRGIVSFDIEVSSPDRDLHSGVYGGAVANPIEILSKIITNLKDNDGKILIDGFYDDVREYTIEERKEFAKIPFDIEKYREEIGIRDTYGEKGYTTIERTGIRPSLDINGIWGGYTDKEGFKTVLPARAYAKVSCRLVPYQDANKIAQLFKNFISKSCPPYVNVKVRVHEGGSNAILVDRDSFLVSGATEAFKKVWGKSPILTLEGGSIPVLSKMSEKLSVPILFLGFGLASNNIHSPNENFDLECFYKGLRTLVDFYGGIK